MRSGNVGGKKSNASGAKKIGAKKMPTPKKPAKTAGPRKSDLKLSTGPAKPRKRRPVKTAMGKAKSPRRRTGY